MDILRWLRGPTNVIGVWAKKKVIFWDILYWLSGQRCNIIVVKKILLDTTSIELWNWCNIPKLALMCASHSYFLATQFCFVCFIFSIPPLHYPSMSMYHLLCHYFVQSPLDSFHLLYLCPYWAIWSSGVILLGFHFIFAP